MLKTVETSRAEKTNGIAVTYRAGNGEKYATCPASCKMNCSGKGAQEIDADYFDALLDAVPNKGQSFTYTHFSWNKWADKLKPGKTVVNFSADTLVSAAAASRAVPTVVVLPESEWENGKKTSAPLFGRTNNRGDLIVSDRVPVVRCPAEYRDGFSCRDCGNGDPLCARLDRNFIIGFTAHGAKRSLTLGCHQQPPPARRNRRRETKTVRQVFTTAQYYPAPRRRGYRSGITF